MTTPAPEIRSCRTRAELLAVIDLCDRAFAKTPRSYFERHVLSDSTLRPEDTLVLLVEGTIVSSVQIFPRTMQVGAATVLCAGIGNVATDPGAQGAGFASLLMRHALAELDRREWPVALLSTSINSYYERFGFRTIVRDSLQFGTLPPGREEGIRLFERASDFASVRSLYEEYNSGAVGPIYRDQSYWEAQFAFGDEDPSMFLVLEEEGSICGYIRGAVQKGCLQVMEFSARGDVPKVFERLLLALARRAPGVPAKIILSRRERERVSVRLPFELQRDSEMMIAIRCEQWQTRLEGPVFHQGEFQFWRTDFF